MLQKVLIVDDSELIHHMYRLVMQRYGCQFLDAMNGQEALDILQREDDIELILLDINMPVMNGVQFMEKAGELGIGSRIPIVVISTEGKEEDTVLALRLGARGYLKKPFNSTDLYNLVEKILPAQVQGSRPSSASLTPAEAC
ncbi:response regulator [Geomonas sp. Red32]|uniref:response regulator n=1 Tax=Geomonas sp. Red32 TaxID=2912856 RepID=UPI00202CB8F5|nr:response regulator [Geomonas sp. Red32]MCM0081107.1 response regulator [Geomonas sp. Red32]